GSQGLYGGEKTTYTMGAREPQLFETHFEARVGSSISGRNSEATLLVGKYEVTKAQYVVVMGAGVLEAGIAVLTQKSRDPRVRELLQDYMDPKSPCHRVLTRNIVQLLAEPITFLSYRDYVE